MTLQKRYHFTWKKGQPNVHVNNPTATCLSCLGILFSHYHFTISRITKISARPSTKWHSGYSDLGPLKDKSITRSEMKGAVSLAFINDFNPHLFCGIVRSSTGQAPSVLQFELPLGMRDYAQFTCEAIIPAP